MAGLYELFILREFHEDCQTGNNSNSFFQSKEKDELEHEKHFIQYHEGLFNMFTKICKIIKKAKEKYIIKTLYEYKIDLDDRVVIPNLSCNLVRADKNSLKKTQSKYPRELTLKKYDTLIERLGNKDEECYLIINNENKVCGYTHFAYADHFHESISYLVKLDQNEIYFFDTYIFNKYRRKGLQTFSILKRFEMAYDKGYCKGRALVDSNNIASNKAYFKCGFKKTSKIYCFPLFNKNFFQILLRKVKSLSNNTRQNYHEQV